MTLTRNADIPRKEGKVQLYPVAATTQIWKNALVCVNPAGFLVPAANAANFSLVGRALEEADNDPGADGAISCRVIRGATVRVVASSITQAMVGEMMYVVNDQTVDDALGTFGIKAGILVEYISATSGWIDLVQSGGQGAVATNAPSVTSANAVDLATVITLANEIKADYNLARTLINEQKTIINTYLK